MSDEIKTAPGLPYSLLPYSLPNGGRRHLCMPVGPAGIKAATAQILIGLVKACHISVVHTCESHVITARNMSWASALQRSDAERVLWIDTDVSAPIGPLVKFLEDADRRFNDESRLAWIGALCVRRGGNSYAFYETEQGHLWLGLGLAYWDVARMKEVFKRDGRNPYTPFRWIPPYSEDYDASRAVWEHGYRCAIDKTLPTYHDGGGEWSGAEDEEGEATS